MRKPSDAYSGKSLYVHVGERTVQGNYIVSICAQLYIVEISRCRHVLKEGTTSDDDQLHLPAVFITSLCVLVGSSWVCMHCVGWYTHMQHLHNFWLLPDEMQPYPVQSSHRCRL